jgi:hypothetical protein
VGLNCSTVLFTGLLLVCIGGLLMVDARWLWRAGRGDRI